MILSQKFVSATPANVYSTFAKNVPAPYLRRSFNIDKLPEKAEITVTSLGFYRLFVNGCDITKGILAPYISNSDHVVYFDNYDITKYLTKGENVLGFMLGNGFQNCPGGIVWSLEVGAHRSSPKLAFALEYDGNVIEADENVLTFNSPILFDDFHTGVHYDASLEVKDWNKPGFDASGWNKALFAETPRGEFRLCTADPITIYKELSPVKIEENVYLAPYEAKNKSATIKETFYDSTEDDKKPGYLYDFGENNAGVFRLKIKNTKKGQRIIIQAAEIHFAKPGTVDFSNIYFAPNGYSQRIIYTCRGDEEEIFVPDFIYLGFRYLWIMGVEKEQVTDELLTYLVASSALKKRADFKCSDEITNKLWEMSCRSDVSNFYYFPTDCPHREKGGWTGDASLSSEHILMKFDADASYNEWFANIRHAQNYKGQIPGIIPTSVWGYDWGNGPLFDSVIFNVPYYMYLYRGNTEMIKDNAIMMMRYLDYISKVRDDKGLIHIGLGDWCPIARDTCDNYYSPLEFTDTAMIMDCSRKAALMFDAIGLSNQAEFAENLYYETRKAIRDNLIDFNTMSVVGNSQTGQALGLAFDIFDISERKEAYNRLIDYIEEGDEHLYTGILGGRYVFNMLSDFGDAELAYHMITRPDYPSFGELVHRGFTTLPETFEPVGGQVNSLNHHFWGHITGWYLKAILGIRVNPTETDCNNINIKPNFISSLDFAEGYLETNCGKLEVKWVRENENIKLTVNCPEGIYGDLVLPAGYKAYDKALHQLRAGETVFVVNNIYKN